MSYSDSDYTSNMNYDTFRKRQYFGLVDHLFPRFKIPQRLHNEWIGNFNETLRLCMEIWKIQDLPYRFETTENWPALFHWGSPHVFIVPDSFFPDH